MSHKTTRSKLVALMIHSVTFETLAERLDEGIPDSVPLQGRAAAQAYDLVAGDDALVLEVYERLRSHMYHQLQQANALADELNKEAGA